MQLEDSKCASYSKLNKSSNCSIKYVEVNFETTFRSAHLNIYPCIGFLPGKGLFLGALWMYMRKDSDNVPLRLMII